MQLLVHIFDTLSWLLSTCYPTCDLTCCDSLQDRVTYRMIPTSLNASDYFLVNFENGDVYVRRELFRNPSQNRYSVSC